jgi:hypothetical protein
MPSMDYLSEPSWILVAPLIESINVIRATSLKDLSCQKSATDKERRGPYSVAYSLLHSQDGSVSYINRSKEPAFLNTKEAELSIERYSRKFGDSPRIMKMPHRNGLPDGVIAVWGKVTLEPLDQESIKTLADGKSPKKGFLVDYLRNFTRSAKEAYPSTGSTAVQVLFGRQVSIRKAAGHSDWQQ